MYNLIVDSGNTTIKMFLFVDGEIAQKMVCNELPELLPTLKANVSLDKIDRCIVSSVSVAQSEIAELIRPFFPVLEFSSRLKLPIIIK